jgi:hypothetical protein
MKRWDNFREQKQMAIDCLVAMKEQQQRSRGLAALIKVRAYYVLIRKKLTEVRKVRAH